jgi:opacity protein-like surface antigen
MKKVVAIAALVAGTAFAPIAASAASIQTGTLDEVVNQFSSSLTGRWRDLGENTNGENNLFLEAPSITPPPDAQAVVNPVGNNVGFAFSYDGSTSIGSMSLNGVSVSVDYTGDADRPADFNDLLIKLRLPNDSASMMLSGLELNGTAVAPASISTNSAGESFWFILDAFSNDTFELTGIFSASGLTNSNEANRFEIIAGNYTPEVIPLPAAAWLLLAGVGGLAVAGRKRRQSA